MKKQFLLCIAAVLSLTGGYSQSKNAWTAVKAEQAAAMGEISPTFAIAKNNISFVTVNVDELKRTLYTAPKKSSGSRGIEITLPNIKGSAEHFIVLEASNFSPALQAQFPDIRSYVGSGVEDPTAHLRLSISPKGIQTMVLRGDAKTEFIEPYTTNSEVYAVFNSGAKRADGELPFNCTTADDRDMQRITSPTANRAALSDAQVFKTLRLALSCTGEYAQFHGGTVAGALEGMNATMSRINGIYEVDLAVNLILIDEEASIIFTNPATDPYTGINSWNGQLQNTLTEVIGEDAYDIGHVFGASGGGGSAGCIGCVCVDGSKGSAKTAPSNNVPQGDTFDIDYVAHEMGHQLGANHTYSYFIENNSSVQTEPGSGSSIMGYAGITGSYDVQSHSDDYFTYGSIKQIQNNLANKSCPVTTDLHNPEMLVNAGADYSIPKGTPFVLRAIGAENNPATITYTWEQNDDATNLSSEENSFAVPTKTTGAIFRSLAPGTSSTRYFPAFSNVVRNALTTKWETVSNVSRILHFALTGRDNVAGGGQTNTDQTNITVKGAAGPFIVTSQNSETEAWAVGSEQTVTWNVAGTTANNINVANVNILLSTDAGETFTTLLANTPNDGSEVITVPATANGVRCRIMVESVGNVFYALSQKEFSIGYAVTNNCTTYTNSTGLNIPDNRASFTNQNLAIAAPGVAVSSVKVVVDATHTYLGDLIINIVNPSGTVVNLWDQQCNENDNLNVTFAEFSDSVACASPTAGTYIPQESLSAFAGANANGNWRLRVRDNAGGDTGNINSWSVIVCTQTLTPLATESFGLKEFAIFPNPNSGSFTVQFNSESQNKISILVNDISGREVYNNIYSNTGVFSGNVNLQNVQQGVYLVTVQDGIRKESRKIVIK
jgi:subtilisin-like proprotein convertase family protein